MLVGWRVQPYICYAMELAMFVFLVLLILYTNRRYTNRICKGHKDLPSCKAVLEAIKFWPLNSKTSLPVLKWTFESEFQFFFADVIQSKSNHLTPPLHMHGWGGG